MIRSVGTPRHGQSCTFLLPFVGIQDSYSWEGLTSLAFNIESFGEELHIHQLKITRVNQIGRAHV